MHTVFSLTENNMTGIAVSSGISIGVGQLMQRPREMKDDLMISKANTIIIAEDLEPSDLLRLNINQITGFAIQKGSRQSFTAIVAGNHGIPAIVGCGAELKQVRENDLVILDGNTGILLINPERRVLDRYIAKKVVELRRNQNV